MDEVCGKCRDRKDYDIKMEPSWHTQIRWANHIHPDKGSAYMID